jgi:competence protein ComEC
VLFDCGGGRLKTAARVVAPYLWREGVRAVDAIYLSHCHADHTNAVLDVADRFRVGKVFIGPYFAEGEGARRILAGLRERGIPIETLVAGARTAPAQGIEVEALAPAVRPARGGRRGRFEEEKPVRGREQNDASLVLRVTTGGRRLLFPGDVEAAGIEALLASRADLAADLVVIPHHGSKNARAGDLARAVGAAHAIASARPGFPVAATMGAFAEAGAVYETGRGGAVLADLSAAGVSVRSFLRPDEDRRPLMARRGRVAGASRRAPRAAVLAPERASFERPGG